MANFRYDVYTIMNLEQGARAVKLFAIFVSFFTKICDALSHLVSIGIRIWMFDVFFTSGLLKFNSWDSTLTLFQYEYNVTLIPIAPPLAELISFKSPELSHVVAAYAGTAAELILPCLLVLGIFGRLPAIALFVFNYVAMASYPYLWTEDGLTALKDHYIWGLAIGFVVFKGHGIFSLDFLLNKKCEKYKY